jgi:arginyl-tRNA synthetase
LGVSFEKVYYESNTYLQGKDIVAQGVEDGVFQTLDDGAVVFDLEKIGKTGRKVLLRGDGTSVYMTQDLGTALQRFDEFGMDRMAYVVADEQAYHFEVLFGVLGTLRENLKGAFTHLSYGMVHLPEGKMKSREGKVVDADDLMDGMAALAAGEIRNREEEAASRGETPLTDAEIMARAESIGLAALKYYLLSFTPGATITFDPKKSIDFLGQTGPYCLYAYARVQSLLRRAGDGMEGREWNTELANLLTSPLEQAVIRALQAVPSTFLAAAETVDTSKIADQTYKVAKSFSTLYNDRNHQIVGNKNAELGAARLFLARSVAHAIKAGLSVLGIDTVDKM